LVQLRFQFTDPRQGCGQLLPQLSVLRPYLCNFVFRRPTPCQG
jgi:hypothetical protein